MSKPLTKRQSDILAFIIKHRREKGEPPTRREIAKATKTPLSTVQSSIEILTRAGRLRVWKDSARGIEVIK